MNYTLRPELLGDIFAVPAAVVDEHIRLAGSAQLKVLLWALRAGKGSFDVERCAAAIGLSAPDCADAMQYWFQTGVLIPREKASAVSSPAAEPQTASAEKNAPREAPASARQQETSPHPAARPRPVKPQMKEVIARQKSSPDFAYLLDTASARLGKAITNGDMETLLYLYDTAGLPAEVILMVIEYAVGAGKYHMRYIEKVALDWADRGIDTIDKAEQHLCRLERRRQAWDTFSTLCGIKQSPTLAQAVAAETWICDWNLPEPLLRLAFNYCVEKTGKFNCSYMNKVLERWHLDGITEEAQAAETLGSRKARKKKETSFDLDEYEDTMRTYTPVYKKE